MSLPILLPMLIAFALSAGLGPVVIPFLLRLKVGQTIRDEGPQSHLKKNGTPTMGGILILIGAIIGSVIFAGRFPKIIPILILTCGFGLIGFVDDYIKVVLKRSMGLRAYQKMALQIVVSAIFLWYIVSFADTGLEMIIPFTGGKLLDIGFWAYPLLFFVVIGTVNGSNFTDGLDGLESSVTSVLAVYFVVVSILTSSNIEPIAAAFAGALMGFLVHNLFPAKVFMGDTGSLALGGFVAGCAYMTHTQIFLVIAAFIYVIEVVSVMLQVSYFKITHGKRIFKMAPIHHHFELSGWSETRVVGIFTIVTVLLCAVSLFAL